MNNENEKGQIKELSTWNLPDVVSKSSGWVGEKFPEPTASNMLIYMNKINELVEAVNRLERITIKKQ